MRQQIKNFKIRTYSFTLFAFNTYLTHNIYNNTLKFETNRTFNSTFKSNNSNNKNNI